MKKAIMLAGVAALLASPVLAQAPSGSYGSGNIIFPGVAGGAYAYEPAPARGGDCARRFKSYDARSATYLGRDGRRHICR